MSNPLILEESSAPLHACQAALNKLMQIGLAQTSEQTQADILLAMENGGKITLEADLFPELVYRFFLQRKDGSKSSLCVVFSADNTAETTH